MMNNYRFLETLADIAYIAGEKNFFSGNSRADINTFVYWANQFESLHEMNDFVEDDYITEINKFTERMIREFKANNTVAPY